MIRQKKSDIERIIYSLKHAVCGLKDAYKDEVSFRLEIFLGIIAVILAFTLDISVVKKIMLIGSWSWVLIIELINSSIEAIVDRISLEIHPISKKIKDFGAAAVLLAVINAVIIWSVILFNYYIGG
ncbi:MAG: diacylglycerol kinase [uncultured bacterium]|nr:MAG: diacylglycerol kinase [uncultured bacterium]